MYLETSAMYLLELHRAREADLEREIRADLRRGAHLEAMARDHEPSEGIAGVALGDGSSGRRDPGTDLGRAEDLHPAPGAEHGGRRLVRPVQPQPEP